ncbi:MAG: hypothetical protein K0U41_03595 [Gammaproteobacteria bacterium]|nr:hypothetical protein [Gammaproteobacteria bacterium]
MRNCIYNRTKQNGKGHQHFGMWYIVKIARNNPKLFLYWTKDGWRSSKKQAMPYSRLEAKARVAHLTKHGG